MSGYPGFDVLAILTSLFILMGSPNREPTRQLFSIVPRQMKEDSCGQSVLAGLSGRFPDITGELSLQDMENALLKSGIHSRPVELRLEELLPLARMNYPVVILLSKPAWHYVLLIGEDREMAVIADPSEGTIALEASKLDKRFSGLAIVPVLGDQDQKRSAARLGAASKTALGRVSIIRRKLDLKITETRLGMEREARVRLNIAQSFSFGQGLTFMAEVSSEPTARLELGGTLGISGASLEATIGILIEDLIRKPQPYASAEWAVIHDPMAYFLGVRGSENFEASAGLIHAVNDKTAFEGGLRMHTGGWGKPDWGLDLVGGVHLSLGDVICSIMARTSLEGSGGSVTLALNF